MTILQDLEAARDALAECLEIARVWEPDDSSGKQRQWLVRGQDARKRLSTLIEQVRGQEPDWETRAELAEQQAVCLTEERDHYKALYFRSHAAAPMPAGWEIEPTASGYTVTPPQPGCGGRHVTPDSDNHADQLLYSLAYAIHSALEKPQKGGKAPEFDSAPQDSRNPQTGIKPAVPAVDVEALELPPMPKPLTQVCLREVERGLAFSYWRTPNENYHTDISLQAYARAALRMHLTGGK